MYSCGEFPFPNNVRFSLVGLVFPHLTHYKWSAGGHAAKKIYHSATILGCSLLSGVSYIFAYANMPKNIKHGFFLVQIMKNDLIEPNFNLVISEPYFPCPPVSYIPNLRLNTPRFCFIFPSSF